MKFVEEQLALQVRLNQIKLLFVKKFGTSKRTASRYIRRVFTVLAVGVGDVDRAESRAAIENSAKLAFQVAHKRRDPRGMISSLELMAKLHGLFQPETPEAGDLTVVFQGPADPSGAAERTPMDDASGNGAVPRPGGG